MRKASELLALAALELNTYGWVQGDYGDQESGFCLVGALDRAAGWNRTPGLPWTFLEGRTDEYDHVAYFQAKEYLANTVGCRRYMVSAWNDQAGRTKDEVMTALATARNAALAAGD